MFASRAHVLRAGVVGRRFASDPAKKVLRPDTINQNVRKMEYAVRGELVIRAEDLAKQMAGGKKMPFEDFVSCNIGNPQALGDKPITFFRQVAALCMYEDLAKHVKGTFPDDAIARAATILKGTPGGLGAYSHSKGLPHVRNSVAAFIKERDGFSADPESIYLTDGASPGIQGVLKTIVRDEKDAIMLPIPQYPLYSATVTSLGGRQVGYYLDEGKDWSLNTAELQRAIKAARKENANVRALVVINPGNPTGQCLSKENVKEVVEFCKAEQLVLLADEVYQTNTYVSGRPFVSFKKVVREMKEEQLELFSFHSVSKGMLGECGIRGGYMETVNIHPDLGDQFYKNASVTLCSNTVGQIMVELMVNPPKSGDPSFALYRQEMEGKYQSLKRRAEILVKGLNSLEGYSCNTVQGAMYAFPRITLPKKAVEAARSAKKQPDTFYCLQLLENTGVTVVPGSGFGQVDGTWHFRTTFLPQEPKMLQVIDRMRRFHSKFMDKYRD